MYKKFKNIKSGDIKMDLKEEKISNEDIFKGRLLYIHKDKVMLQNKKEASREVVSHPGGVCIAALTENNELLFVKQYRYPMHQVVLELPAGTLVPGKNPLDEGVRELKEETGAIGKGYMSLGKLYPSPGYCDEIIHLYFCHIDHFEETNFDEDEFLITEKIPIEKAVYMVLNGEIPDSKTQVAVLKTYMFLKMGSLNVNE